MFALHILSMLAEAVAASFFFLPVIYFILAFYSSFNQKEVSEVE
jgi:hypothetical protein